MRSNSVTNVDSKYGKRSMPLSAAVSIAVHFAAFVALSAIGYNLRETGRQTGLMWPSIVGGTAFFGLVPLYCGVQMFRIRWEEIRSWAGRPLLPPAFGGTVLILLGALGVVSGLVGFFRSLPVEPHQITDNTLNLREYWRKSHTHIGGFHYEPLLLAASGRVVCLQFNAVRWTNHLQVFDARSGSLVWEVQGKRWEGAGQLAIDTERVYVIASSEIRAYDLAGGRQLWKSRIKPAYRYFFYSDGEKLYARDKNGEMDYYLDARTGTELGKAPSEDNSGLFELLARFPQFDLYSDDGTMVAMDRATQQPLWVTRRIYGSVGRPYTGFSVVRPPILYDDMLLAGAWERVFALDAQTGQVKWRNMDIPFASNFVVADGYVYAFDESARLVQLDVETGQEAGYIQFIPPLDIVSIEDDSSSRRYWVAADGEMLFVSFSDSQEVIALGP